jgi:hypothetical protein
VNSANLVKERPEVTQPAEPVKPTERPKEVGLPDAAIIKVLIAASIASYASSCACPYHQDRAGRSCGNRSAYSRPGGQAPLCFASDVTPDRIAEYRARDSGQR